jgi:phosphoglycerate kinase
MDQVPVRSSALAQRLRTLEQVAVDGKAVFLRADLNVPLLPSGEVRDATRIDATLPTLRYLLERGCRVVVASHLGRPKGRPTEGMSLRPVAHALSQRLGQEVIFPGQVTGPEVDKAKARIRPGDVMLLENLRFDPREEADDEGFARELAQGMDLAVLDAFGSLHRAHASVHAIARVLTTVAGRLVAQEVAALGRLLDEEGLARPFVLVLGGAKIADKLGVLRHLALRADRVLVGGGMANTFLLAQGAQLGTSLVEPDQVPAAQELAAQLGERLRLPVDGRAARGLDDTSVEVVDARHVPQGWALYDIGPQTEEGFAQALRDAATVFWNGPMGVYERPLFAQGTQAVARAVAAAPGFTVVGGGDSAAAVAAAGLTDRVGHVSTGGGASLELLEGRSLPGLEVLWQS